MDKVANRGLRKSGIDILGEVPWSTHFCQFYQTEQDLLDILVPYFKAGLESNEAGMWVTSEPLSAVKAEAAMRSAVPDLDDYVSRGQFEIVPYTEWYVRGGSFSLDRVLNGWVDKLDAGLSRGFAGLRITGNTAWLEKKDWNDFAEYEAAINDVIGKYRIIALCTCWLDRCNATEVIDVVRNHEFALLKQSRRWEVIQSSAEKKTQHALQISNEKFKLLSETANLLLSSQEPERIVQAICSRVMEHLDCHVFFNYLADEQSRRLHLNAYSGIPESAARDMEWLDYGSAICGCVAQQGSRIIAEKVQDGQDRRADLVRSFGINAYACHPLYSRDKVIGTLSFGTRSRSRFTDDEIGVMKTVADQVAAAMDRKRAEEALRTSDERYRTLFNTMDEGFALHEIILGEDGKPADYRFLELNDAFTRLTGLVKESITGKRVREVLPALEQHWIDTYGRVALTGQPVLFENYSAPLERWYEVYAYSPARGRFCTIFRDITERKRAVEGLAHERKIRETIMENTNAHLAYLDPDFNFVLVNSAYAKGSGHTAEELIGKNHFALSPTPKTSASSSR